MNTLTLLALALGTNVPAPAVAPPTPPAATLVSHVAWHPADSVLYVEAPDLAGARTEWQKTAIARMLADPEVHAAIGALMGTESVDPVPMLMGAVREQDADGKVDMVLRLASSLQAASFSARPTEKSRAALADGSIGDWNNLLDTFGFQVILTFASEEAPRQVVELVAQALGGESAPESVRWNGMEGSAIRSLGPELGDRGQLVQVGPHLILLAGMTTLDDAQARMEGGAPSMAANPGWKAGAELLGGGGTILADIYSNVPSLLTVEEESEVVQSAAFEMAEGLFGTNGAISTRGGRWRMSLNDGQYITNGYQPRNGTELMERILARGPLDAKALSFVNPKAIVAWAVQFEPAELIAALREETADPKDGENLFTFLEARHGLKLDDMLFALGKSATFSMPTPPLTAAPDLQLSLALEDREKFLAGMGPLTAMLTEALEGKGTIETKDYRDTTLTTVEFTIDFGIDGLPVDPAKLFKPTIAVLEDRVLITMTQSFAKKVVRNASKGELEPHEFLQSVSIPEGVAEFGYADWAKMIGSLYSMGKSFGAMAMASQDPGSMPFDLTKLPEAELFLKHFKPSIRWEKRVEGGMFHHSESSFGPDLPLGIGVGAAVAIPAVMAQQQAAQGQALEAEARMREQEEIQRQLNEDH